jgi:hypothetical protein
MRLFLSLLVVVFALTLTLGWFVDSLLQHSVPGTGRNWPISRTR